jgi:8-oxo-dGTP pyrophosphatase MutT (NUDIX family)
MLPAVKIGNMRGDGDGWVVCDQGHRHWGRYGAAGLLLRHSPDGELASSASVLLQHRAPWSHHGDTWGLPGGARDSQETVEEAALREAVEESALDVEQVHITGIWVDDHGGWSYTTVLAAAPSELAVRAVTHESVELRWVAAWEVEALPLHPGFAATWPELKLLLD